MKFSEMPYERPDLDAVKKQYSALTERLKAAGSYEEARTVFLEKEELDKHVQTLATLSHVRHSIDTRDAFYDAEAKFWNAAEPELQEYTQAWTRAMLDGAFRAQFAAQFGELMFVNAEIELKTFSPEIIPELQQENELAQEYEKLLASAQIPFEGGVYTISQMTPFKSDPDDARRLAAWKAEGQWYKDNQGKLDGIKVFGCDGLDGLVSVENFDTSLAEDVMLMTPFTASATDDKTAAFVKAYNEAYGEDPNQFAADAYDAIYAIHAAVEKAGVTADMDASAICDALKAAFTEITLEGLTGKGITWDASGAPAKSPLVYIIKDGVYTAA